MSASHGHSDPVSKHHPKQSNVVGWIQQGFLILAIIAFILGIKQYIRKDKTQHESNGGDFQMYLVNQDGSMNKFGELYSMDSVKQVDSHLEYKYHDKTRSLYFISKGPVDIYFPSCNNPNKSIHKYYCGQGEVNWDGLVYCTGTIKIFKAKKKKCD
jgi:hypothetical protein